MRGSGAAVQPARRRSREEAPRPAGGGDPRHRRRGGLGGRDGGRAALPRRTLLRGADGVAAARGPGGAGAPAGHGGGAARLSAEASRQARAAPRNGWSNLRRIGLPLLFVSGDRDPSRRRRCSARWRRRPAPNCAGSPAPTTASGSRRRSSPPPAALRRMPPRRSPPPWDPSSPEPRPAADSSRTRRRGERPVHTLIPHFMGLGFVRFQLPTRTGPDGRMPIPDGYLGVWFHRGPAGRKSSIPDGAFVGSGIPDSHPRPSVSPSRGCGLAWLRRRLELRHICPLPTVSRPQGSWRERRERCLRAARRLPGSSLSP